MCLKRWYVQASSVVSELTTTEALGEGTRDTVREVVVTRPVRVGMASKSRNRKGGKANHGRGNRETHIWS
jgi:hypothetical protein